MTKISWKSCGCGRKGGHRGLSVSSVQQMGEPHRGQPCQKVHLRAQVGFKFAVRNLNGQLAANKSDSKTTQTSPMNTFINNLKPKKNVH